MASPYSTQPNLPVVINPYGDGPPMPASATGTMFVLASGFGIGALVVLFGFLFLVGIGDIGHPTTSGPTAAAQSAATAPVAPGPAPATRDRRRPRAGHRAGSPLRPPRACRGIARPRARLRRGCCGRARVRLRCQSRIDRRRRRRRSAARDSN